MLSSFAAGSVYVFRASAQLDYLPAGIRGLQSAVGPRDSASVQPQRELDSDQCLLVRRAADLKRSAERFGPVAEADQAQAAGGIGAAHCVVANQVQTVVPFLDRDVLPAGTMDWARRSSRRSETRRCWGPVVQVPLDPASSAAATIRAREAASSARSCAFPTAVARSSVKYAIRSAASEGNGPASATWPLRRRCPAHSLR